jgi:hypothetical protein
MWALFTRALTLATSSVQVSVINTSANFVATAVLGRVVFGEELPGEFPSMLFFSFGTCGLIWDFLALWWVGAAMLIAGSVIIGRREGEDAAKKDGGKEKDVVAGDGTVASGVDVSSSPGVEESLIFECHRDADKDLDRRSSVEEGGVEEERELKREVKTIQNASPLGQLQRAVTSSHLEKVPMHRSGIHDDDLCKIFALSNTSYRTPVKYIQQRPTLGPYTEHRRLAFYARLESLNTTKQSRPNITTPTLKHNLNFASPRNHCFCTL